MLPHNPGLSAEDVSIIDIGPFNINDTLMPVVEINDLLLFKKTKTKTYKLFSIGVLFSSKPLSYT